MALPLLPLLPARRVAHEEAKPARRRRARIDQSFVRGVTTPSENTAITSATIAMARLLGLRVVAEGVEETAQVGFLWRHGCTEFTS